jgi:hypothetical protein
VAEITAGTAVPPSTLRTIGDALNEKNISWAFFGGGFNAAARFDNLLARWAGGSHLPRSWDLKPLTHRSCDNLPNPKTDPNNPYVPTNMSAIGDLFDMFRFSAMMRTTKVRMTST